MELNQYQTLAMRTDSSYKNSKDRLLNGLMGLNGEAGEAIDVAKKHLFQGHELDYDLLAEEIGDVLWIIFRNENAPKPDGYLSIQEFYNLIVKCHGTYKGVPNYNTILKDCKSGKYIGAYQTGKMRKWMIPYFRTYHGYVEIGTYKFDQTYFS